MSTNLPPGVVAPVPQPKLTVDPLKLLPKSRVTKKTTSAYRPYLHYPGSLTTPPCSESVDWFVMVDPMSVTEAQVRAV
jgi:carbonic anhydrase